MSRHILYCNDEADILVLDLPASIARAQESDQCLCSTSAPESPYITPEPKGSKRDALLAAIPEDDLERQREIESTVLVALSFLHERQLVPTWCLPRPRVYLEQSLLSNEPSCLSHSKGHDRQISSSPPLILSSGVNNVCCSSDFTNIVVHNPGPSVNEFVVSTLGRFNIPAQSTFLCSTIEQGFKPFENAVTCLLPEGHFDLVLLDPPWSNRSVRNNQAYHQQSNLFGQIIPAIDGYLSDKAYVAVWITNKTAIRSQVMMHCNNHGLLLQEEWIWLKVTTKGEPVFPIDGLWRKPYEVLLLFRRNSSQQKIIRRVGIAVPDVHSRKPSLKSMFEQLLPEKYNALELFARSLTAGWWSWGDEVLKFQHESNWF